MKVILAKHAGFCMGVRRAVETALEMVRREDNGIATFGPLIHNPQVLDLLQERGVQVLKEVPEKATGTIIIRAHGIPPAQKELLAKSGARIQDSTCPRVVKVQVIIDKHRQQGFATVIIGDKNHAEVEGLIGFAGPSGCVVSDGSDVDKLQLTSPYIIVSQTTQDEAIYDRLSRMILTRFPNGKVFNTICDSTHKRQAEVRDLCSRVEALIVVGGRTSANTQRLGEIARSMGLPVFMIENEDDLDLVAISRFSSVGVTAGASTPSWMINWVVRTLEALPGQGDSVLGRFWYKLFWFLLATNLYVCLGGGLLAYTLHLYQTNKHSSDIFLMAFGYLFAMHNLNRFRDQKSKKINDPLRAMFCRRYRWIFLIVSSALLAWALMIAHAMGRWEYLLLSIMSIFGILYGVRIIPKPLSRLVRVRGLKEIPGSKALFVAMAWAFVVVLMPALHSDSMHPSVIIGRFIFVLLFAYIRCALLDVFDLTGDRIVGKETLPVWIGAKKTIKILYGIIVLLALLLIILPLSGIVTSLAYWLLPGVCYLAILIYLYDQGKINQGPRLEFALESLFVVLTLFVWFGYFWNQAMQVGN